MAFYRNSIVDFLPVTQNNFNKLESSGQKSVKRSSDDLAVEAEEDHLDLSSLGSALPVYIAKVQTLPDTRPEVVSTFKNKLKGEYPPAQMADQLTLRLGNAIATSDLSE